MDKSTPSETSLKSTKAINKSYLASMCYICNRDETVNFSNLYFLILFHDIRDFLTQWSMRVFCRTAWFIDFQRANWIRISSFSNPNKGRINASAFYLPLLRYGVLKVTRFEWHRSFGIPHSWRFSLQWQMSPFVIRNSWIIDRIFGRAWWFAYVDRIYGPEQPVISII